MTTCEFFYISNQTNLPIHAIGLKTTWDDLKQRFNLTGNGYPDADFFLTISPRGPRFFAVVNQTWVLYNENSNWHRYITACGIKYKNSDLSTTSSTEKPCEDVNKEWVVVPEPESDIILI